MDVSTQENQPSPPNEPLEWRNLTDAYELGNCIRATLLERTKQKLATSIPVLQIATDPKLESLRNISPKEGLQLAYQSVKAANDTLTLINKALEINSQGKEIPLSREYEGKIIIDLEAVKQLDRGRTTPILEEQGIS